MTNQVAPVMDEKPTRGVQSPSSPTIGQLSPELAEVFRAPRGYGFNNAGSFRISAGGSFFGRSRSRSGPSPLVIRSAAEEIDKAHHKQLSHNASDFPRTPCSIHPYGTFRQRWDMGTVFLIFYSALSIPYHVAFTTKLSLPFRVISIVVDVLFVVDIFLNFMTGVEIKDKSIRYDHLFIAKEYLKGWFWLDLISAFPYELITNSDSDQIPQVLKVFKLSRLLRLLRLFRLLRIYRIINRLEYSISIQEGFRQLGLFTVVLVLLCHWFSCLFFFLGDHNRDSEGYWATGVNLDGHSPFRNYIAASYWSIMTLTTVGYGDISAITDGQRMLGIVTMIAGALFYAYGVSHVVSIVDEVRAESRTFKARMDKFNGYMAARNLPTGLRGDIREFLHNKRKRQKASIRDEENLLGQLSMGLRSRVAMAINEQYLKEMPFFLGADVNLTMELALNMESIFFPAFEDVVREGEEGDAMYFIVAGSVEVLVGHTQTRVAVLVEKQYFGEAALLMPEGSRRRTATVRTLQFSEFRLLRVQDFLRILVDYPDTRKQIEQLAETRMRVLNKKKGPQSGKMQSKRVIDTIQDRTRPSQKLGSRTMMDSFSSMDPEGIMKVLDQNDADRSKIQEHIEAIQQAQQDTQNRLEQIQSFISSMRDTQGEVRRASLKLKKDTPVVDSTAGQRKDLKQSEPLKAESVDRGNQS